MEAFDNHYGVIYLNFQQHPSENITPPEVYSGKVESITVQNEQIHIPNLGLL
jgi:hypothetical protein